MGNLNEISILIKKENGDEFMGNEKIEEYINYLEGSIKLAIENSVTQGNSTRGALWEGAEIGYSEALRVFREIMDNNYKREEELIC